MIWSFTLQVSIGHPACQATARNHGSQKAKPGPNGRGRGIWFRATRWQAGEIRSSTQCNLNAPVPRKRRQVKAQFVAKALYRHTSKVNAKWRKCSIAVPSKESAGPIKAPRLVAAGPRRPDGGLEQKPALLPPHTIGIIPTSTKAGDAKPKGWQWRAADRSCVPQCGHSSRRAPGASFDGGRVDSRGVGPRSLNWKISSPRKAQDRSPDLPSTWGQP
jgi:hypothetical protein